MEEIKLKRSGFHHELVFGIRFPFGGAVPAEVYTGGIYFGPHVYMIYYKEGYAIFKVPGTEQWSGLGQTRYVETLYMVVKLFTDGGQRARVYATIEPGSRWRKAIQLCKDEIDRLIEKGEEK